MCTAVCYRKKYSYFGRNLDLERGYDEKVVITPRNFCLKMRCAQPLKHHYSLIGMATVIDNFPLYYEATNEKGLSIAALNFPKNAYYNELIEDKINITSFELILWILGQCTNIAEAKKLLKKTNIINLNYSETLPATPLHWMISDKNNSITVEKVKDGLKIYDNPFEVLTNNPSFEFHKENINNYMGLSIGPAETKFKKDIPLYNYSLGMGAIGLPGDYSSASRFVRCFFVKENSVSNNEEKSIVNQFFHILNSVSMPKGCVLTNQGFEYTRYTSCCNAEKGVYYYSTYDDFSIKKINMYDVDLNKSVLYIYQVKSLK